MRRIVCLLAAFAAHASSAPAASPALVLHGGQWSLRQPDPDPAAGYRLTTSTDLRDWSETGLPQRGSHGDLDFPLGSAGAPRFYRLETITAHAPEILPLELIPSEVESLPDNMRGEFVTLGENHLRMVMTSIAPIEGLDFLFVFELLYRPSLTDLDAAQLEMENTIIGARQPGTVGYREFTPLELATLGGEVLPYRFLFDFSFTSPDHGTVRTVTFYTDGTEQVSVGPF